MATLTATRNRIDAFVDAKLEGIHDAQSDFHAANGRHWQGLPTHDRVELPSHSGGDDDKAAAHPNRKPSGESHDWTGILSILNPHLPESVLTGIKLPASLQVSTYGGPDGDGYVLSAEFDWDGVVWRRDWNTGPETYRDHDWRTLLEADVP